jgi:hypothetical protein
VRPEGLIKLQILSTSSDIEPTTILLVAQYINHYATAYRPKKALILEIESRVKSSFTYTGEIKDMTKWFVGRGVGEGGCTAPGRAFLLVRRNSSGMRVSELARPSLC